MTTDKLLLNIKLFISKAIKALLKLRYGSEPGKDMSAIADRGRLVLDLAVIPATLGFRLEWQAGLLAPIVATSSLGLLMRIRSKSTKGAEPVDVARANSWQPLWLIFDLT